MHKTAMPAPAAERDSLRILGEVGSVCVPRWVKDLDSFRRWAKSDEFPERGRFAHLDGQLWVDLSMEKLTHNKAKGKIVSVLTLLIEQAESGEFLHDGMLLTHKKARLSTEPDGMFVSIEAVEAGRAQLKKADEKKEVVGTPDMVLEVVSTTSEKKDTEILYERYWKAGVREYWLVDPRGETAQFDIFRHTAKGYATARKQAGWVKSTVFGKSFRLTTRTNKLDNTDYFLEVR